MSEPTGVVIADSSERFKLAQALYSTVTGKTEKLGKAYSEQYRISINDLVQLDAKCHQVCGQWVVIQKSENVTIHYVDDAKEQFSSFDRFKLFDASKTSPTESVVYEFNLLIQQQNVDKPQPYNIVIRTMSHPAMLQRMDRLDTPFPAFMKFIGGSSIVVEIEYVDYLVARQLQSTVDSWVSHLDHVQERKLIALMQKYTHLIPPIFQVTLVLLAATAVTATIPVQLASATTFAGFAHWLIWAAMIVWVAGIFAKLFGRFVETSIDTIQPLGGIVLNKGDQRLLEKCAKRTGIATVKSVVGTVLAITQGAVSKSCAALLVSWLSR
jgi:hypothetical protein